MNLKNSGDSTGFDVKQLSRKEGCCSQLFFRHGLKQLCINIEIYLNLSVLDLCVSLCAKIASPADVKDYTRTQSPANSAVNQNGAGVFSEF